MITLTINNSMSRVDGLSVEQHNTLKQILSYKASPEAARYGQNRYNPTKYLLDKNGNFPTGLLYLVEKFLSSPIQPIVRDNRKRPEPLQSTFTMRLGVTPYPEQLEAAKACQEAYRGIVTAPTGLGKTVICALIINSLQVKTLIVVPTLELKRQLTSSLSTAFGSNRVGYKKDIWVENIDSIDAEHELQEYGCVIIDEFHHSAASTYRKANKKAWKNVYYRFGLTATPFRSQEHERLLLESILSKVIYRIDYDKAVKNQYIVPLEAYYYELPKQEVKGHTWGQVYSELIVRNDLRNKLIVQLLKNLADQPTLCLVKEIKHGEILSEATNIAFANGQSDNTRELILEFALNERKCLIGTTGVMGEGVDTKPCEYVIIAGLGKSKNAFMQQVGRGFRKYLDKESCKVILFKDNSHKWTKAHFAAQVKYLEEEYGIIPVKLISFNS